MLHSTVAIVLQAAPGTGALATWANVAIIVIAVAFLAMAVMAGTLMLRFNRIMTELRRSTHQNFGPVSDRARSISDNVEFITQALRTDVEKLNASVRALSDRLHQASDRMEERIEEFNALMEVVQGEAEEIFIDTASTVRGVREGARAITRGASGDGSRSASSRERARVPSRRDTPAPPEEPRHPRTAGARSVDPDGPDAGAPPPSPDPGASKDEVVERAAPAADEDKAVRTGED